MLKEFKEFAMKGSMLDLAIGVVIGAAFGSIVTSLVSDVLMPLIGVATGGMDFKDKFIILKEGTVAGPYANVKAAKDAGANILSWGNFVNAIIYFLIVAFCLFLVVKAVNKMRKAEEPVPEPDPEPTNEERLLTEIRDLLKK